MKHQLLRIARAIIARADTVLDRGRSLIAKSYQTNVNQVLASAGPGGENLALIKSNLAIFAERITRPVTVSLRAITT